MPKGLQGQMTVSTPPFHKGRLGELLIFVILVGAFGTILGMLPIHSSSVGLVATLETSTALFFAAIGVLALRAYWRSHA